MIVAVIGCSQGCGRLTTIALAKRGVQVRALARTTDKSRAALEPDLSSEERARISYMTFDVTTEVDNMASALRDCDAVIFAASASHLRPFGFGNAHPQSPQYVDYLGVKKVAHACVKNQVYRMVLISSFDADKKMMWVNVALNSLLGNVSSFKVKGEEALRETFKSANKKVGDLEQGQYTYAIIRPGFLKNRKGAGPGKIKAGGRIKGSIGIAREDVAEICAEAAVSGVPVGTYDFTTHTGKPKGGYWVEKRNRTPVANSWKELLEHARSLESLGKKRDVVQN